MLKGAISKSQAEKGEFVSNLSTVEKKKGKFRPVINLKRLNESVQDHHCANWNLQKWFLSSVKKNYSFVKIDLKHAYLSISVFEGDRKYLKFLWKGVLYQCNALFFGLPQLLEFSLKL